MLEQIHDFGIMLTLEDGKLAVRSLMRLLWLLMMLVRERSSEYVNAIIMQLLILCHQMDNELPHWHILRDSLSTYNEEAGEISFSMLARAVLGDTLKNKIEHMDKMYTLIHTFRSVEEDLHTDTDRKGKSTSWRHSVDASSEEVVSTVAHFSEIIRGLQQGTFKVYDGSMTSFKNRTHALRNLEDYKCQLPLWQPDQTGRVRRHLARCKKTYISYWTVDFSDIWPEMSHNPEDFAVIHEDNDAVSEVEDDDLLLTGEELENAGEIEEAPWDQFAKPVLADDEGDSGEDEFSPARNDSDGEDVDVDDLVANAESKNGDVSRSDRKIGRHWSEVGGAGNVLDERPRQRRNRGIAAKNPDFYMYQ